jgi:Spy/CpxP family protein refolding chaperone
MTPVRMRWKVLGGMTLGGLLAAGAALAGPGHGQDGFGGPMAGALRQLDLSDDQKTKVKAILDEERPKVRPLFDETRVSRRALLEAESAAKFDESSVRAAAQAVAGAEADLAVAKARLNARLRSILTPDQQAKLDALRQSFLDRAGQWPQGRRGRWHHGPEGGTEQQDPGASQDPGGPTE